MVEGTRNGDHTGSKRFVKVSIDYTDYTVGQGPNWKVTCRRSDWLRENSLENVVPLSLTPSSSPLRTVSGLDSLEVKDVPGSSVEGPGIPSISEVSRYLSICPQPHSKFFFFFSVAHVSTSGKASVGKPVSGRSETFV